LLYERNFKERKHSILIDRRSRNEEALKKKMKKQQQQQGTKDMKEQKPTIQRLDTSKKTILQQAAVASEILQLKERYNTDDNKNFGKKITHLSIPDQSFFLCAEPKRRRRRTGVSDRISSTVETNPRPPFTCSLGPLTSFLARFSGRGTTGTYLEAHWLPWNSNNLLLTNQCCLW
jgi:hypothetical protein